MTSTLERFSAIETLQSIKEKNNVIFSSEVDNLKNPLWIPILKQYDNPEDFLWPILTSDNF